MSRRIERRRARKGPAASPAETSLIEGIQDMELGAERQLIPFSSESCIEPKRTLDLFNEVLKDILQSPTLHDHIQEVKRALYNRDYMAAFDTDNKRFAYVSRWTPARALSYSSLFASFQAIKRLLADKDQKRKVLCVGGGAASELVGIASLFCRLKEFNPNSDSQLDVTIVDIANWSTVVTHFTSYIKSHWIYKPEKLNTTFIEGDILDSKVISNEGFDVDFITLLFTTNELFCAKRSETIKFLQRLNTNCKKGAYLLIAESAGSYSHITVGTKKFPVQFLVDTILVGKPNDDNGAWEIVDSSESCWYRINEKEVSYPMKLENMRFFFRLYRKR